MLKISKEAVGVVILWAAWLSSSVIYLMVKVAVLEDRALPRHAAAESNHDVWASAELFHVPELLPNKAKE